MQRSATEIKSNLFPENISAQPLNISADELTERFLSEEMWREIQKEADWDYLLQRA